MDYFDTFEVEEYEFNMKLEVLHISARDYYSSKIIQIVAVDESNQMRMVKLSFGESFLLVEKNIVSKPLDYFLFSSAIFGTA
jgi:hypothetical protein